MKKILLMAVILNIFLASFLMYKLNSTINSTENTNMQQLNNENIEFDTHFTNTDYYGVAPSRLTKEDLPRPSDNKEWIRKLNINFPQLYKMENYEIQECINNLLFEESLNINNVLYDRDYIEYNVDYEIMESSNNILSIFFTGNIDSTKGSNSFSHSITIDIQNGKRLKISDFIDVDSSLLNKYINNEFELVENNFNTIEENNIYLEEYDKNYRNSNHENDFYVRNGTIVLIVPTHNSMGYILLKGKYAN